MTTWLRRLVEVESGEPGCFGGKCQALSELARQGFLVPGGVCISFDAYERFVGASRLKERMHFELGRKRFEDMRWEEMWDLALRIRNMFVNSAYPHDLKEALAGPIRAVFGDDPVVVRSSAAGEDSKDRSFAGLHESYVNVQGTQSILDHVKMVWASLWSDRALLYRQELGLDTGHSVMGVVVQRLMAGEVSGVAFSMSPESKENAVIEAVYGLNQGLVDGTVEPDHWVVDRGTGEVVTHRPADRLQAMRPVAEGLNLVELSGDLAERPPLDRGRIAKVKDMALRAESVFGSPQDVEWTIADGRLYTLQSRPITTLKGGAAEDERAWYLTLTRSFDNLKALREKIEGETIPGMERDAAELALADLDSKTDGDLAAEIDRRAEILERWTRAYWADCIPFAHGMRLFGQVYNDTVRPDDPYEFMNLLTGQETLGLKRNRMLEEMAGVVRANPELAQDLDSGRSIKAHAEFARLLDAFAREYGGISRADGSEPPPAGVRGKIAGLVLEMAGREPAGAGGPAREGGRLLDEFLSRFEAERRDFARDLLDLARASYRWRDDDNIYLARVEAEAARAVNLGRRRLEPRLGKDAGALSPEEVSRCLRDPGYRPAPRSRPEDEAASEGEGAMRPRQLTGLPAGPGLGTGTARVIVTSEDLYDFKTGQVLVCDAIEPEMTLIVPLAAAIVERRGGMLIHGAIVAREYGIPCVTGVPDAAALIKNGDTVTVDGYLGIVIVEGDGSGDS
jgi:pyruvate,water dikinase